MNVTHVSVGVILRDNQVLLAWRNNMLDQGNCFEFPGGKVDAGETPAQALVRELQEELNITPTGYSPLSRVFFQYPSKLVCLHVFVVNQFNGTPFGAEDQAIGWKNLSELPSLTFPAANYQIVRQLTLPCVYAITADTLTADNLDLASLATYPQQQLLYVRVPSALSPQAYIALVKKIIALRPDLRLSLAIDRVYLLTEVTMLELASIAAVHIPTRHILAVTLDTIAAIRQAMPHAISFVAGCHTNDQVLWANQLGLDAIAISPVLATPSHPDATLLGWEAFARLAEAANMPVWALGGMQTDLLSTAQQHGAYGMAGISLFA